MKCRMPATYGLFAILLLFSTDAHAYMDPGSGSFVVQMIIAGLVGASVTVKMYWKRIVGLFSRSSKTEEIDDLDD